MTDTGDQSPVSMAFEMSAEANASERLRITLVDEGGDWMGFGRLDNDIRRAAWSLARHPRCALQAGAEASVVLADDAFVQRLNQTYRGKDAPTNVLSFPSQAVAGAEVDLGHYLGDVILAAGTIRREAAELAIAPIAHVQHLVVHGLLHLLGFDHGTDAQAEEMEGLEREILEAIGLDDPYATHQA